MKICSACSERKSTGEFYSHPKTADRLLAICKSCHKTRMRKRRRENPSVQAYDRERAKRPEKKASIQAAMTAWRKRHPDGYRAHKAVGNALASGKIVRPAACEACGDEAPRRLHAHHDDYSRPLAVQWLCALCHHRRHGAERIAAE